MTDANRFTIGVRVYYEDTDASGVVYHADYLRYCERARTQWLDSCGLGHRRLADEYGVAFTLRDMAVRFIRPARLDDRLTVDVAVGERRGARVVFEQRIRRGDELLLEGQFTVVCVNIDDFRPRRLPEALF
jgi:acyl-CoA thioester hydrolase